MKKVSVVIVFVLCSCTTLRYVMDEIIINKDNCIAVNVNGVTLIPVEIENQKHSFIFDTGAMGSVILDSTIIQNFSAKKFASFGIFKGADGKVKKNKRFTVKASNGLFESDNKVFSFSNFPYSFCNRSNSFKGILGLDAFFNNQSAMVLDFSLGKVCTIPSDNLPSILKTNQYLLVKSRCKYNQVFVYLTIEGKEYQFKLDTGYTGSIILPNSKNSTFKNPNKIILQGTLYKTISTIPFGEDILYEKMPVSFAGIDLESKATVSESIKAQNLGIDFIKGFDWIIDYNHNKVYVKRNQNKIESNFSRKGTYYVRVVQEKLVIIIKEKSQTKYQLGDQILSVNDQKVSVSNACELEEFLNKTEDWGTIKLEVLSASKQ